MISKETDFRWQRFWVPHGEDQALAKGYFVEPDGSGYRWLRPRSNGVVLGSLQEVPVLVLLGDVGMRKSTALRAEADVLQGAVELRKHQVLWHDLKRASETQTYRQGFEHEKMSGWLRGETALTVFLDSVDEGWRRID